MLIARGTETKTGSLYLDGPLMDTTLSTEIWTQKGAQGLIEYWNGLGCDRTQQRTNQYRVPTKLSEIT